MVVAFTLAQYHNKVRTQLFTRVTEDVINKQGLTVAVDRWCCNGEGCTAKLQNNIVYLKRHLSICGKCTPEVREQATKHLPDKSKPSTVAKTETTGSTTRSSPRKRKGIELNSDDEQDGELVQLDLTGKSPMKQPPTKKMACTCTCPDCKRARNSKLGIPIP